MSSKKKKPRHSKPSQDDDQTAVSSDCSAVSPTLFPTEEEFLSILDEASARFAPLISRAAFVGQVVETAVSDAKGCKVFLSKSVIGSYSFQPGSLVSVSLLSLGKGPRDFPLSSLTIECAENFGLLTAGGMADEAGTFFAIAEVHQHPEILKNGVSLSTSLLCSLGCPLFGRIVFIHPVQINNLTGNDKLPSAAASHLLLKTCEELYLSPVYFGGVEMEEPITPNSSLPPEVSSAPFSNGEVLSFMKQSRFMPKVSSPCSSQSELADRSQSKSKATHLGYPSMDVHDLDEMIADDFSRKMLEICIASHLTSRSLLLGNIVMVSLLSKQYFFQVVQAKKISSSCKVLNGGSFDPELGHEIVSVIPFNWGMKVKFLISGDSIGGTPSRLTNPALKFKCKAESSILANFPKLGGLSKEFAVLKDIISAAAQATFTRFGVRPTKGVLLHGPPGTGKTALSLICANDAGINIFTINGPEIIGHYHGETEQALHEVFDKAGKASPSVVFIDELDALAPARKDGGDELSQGIVATLLNLLDGVSRSDGILVIAATNRPDSIEPALRRPGRFDREIEIGVPSPGQRHEILVTILSEMEHSLSGKEIQHIAMVTHGFVGADLADLCNKAAFLRLQKYDESNTSCDCKKFMEDSASDKPRLLQDLTTEHDLDALQGLGDSSRSNVVEASISSNSIKQNSSAITNEVEACRHCYQNCLLRISYEDFEKARVRVRPSAMREVILEIPKVNWGDVGGQMEVKAQLMEAVVWPQRHKDAFERIGTRPPTGILLFGPPGCSKTLLARAVASEAELNFLAIKGPELLSKWVGESEKAVRSLFAKARANAPSIIFFDEIDGLAITRGKENDGVSVGDRVISQLLVELDGLQERGTVTVIAATNRPDKIDPALLRPGRFDRLLYVGPPNEKDREDIFRVHLRGTPCCPDVSISQLSRVTAGFTGAHISLICRAASLRAIEEDPLASEIKMEHLKYGIQQVLPSDVGMYEELSAKFGRLVHLSAAADDKEDVTGVSFWGRLQSFFHLASAIVKLMNY